MSKHVLIGYGVPSWFEGDPDTEIVSDDGVRQRWLPGAVGWVAGHHPQVDLLVAHDESRRLGTARLFADGTGLRVEAELPATRVGMRVAAAARAGRLGLSVGFTLARGDYWESRDGAGRRVTEITTPVVREVSVTRHPRCRLCVAAVRAATPEGADPEVVREVDRVRLQLMQLDVLARD